jgi:hypothetical protein
MLPTSRRFPPPWSIEELNDAFVVKDSKGQKAMIILVVTSKHLRPNVELALCLPVRDVDH